MSKNRRCKTCSQPMKGDLSPLEQAEKIRYAKEYETCASISELARKLWVSWPTAAAKLKKYKLMKVEKS